jgi:hypothetical protein
MAWNFFNRSKTKNTQRFAERDNSGEWMVWFNQYGGIKELEKFSEANSFQLAGGIAEIFFPIDMIADGCASLEYNIVDRETLKEVEFKNANIMRLLEQPNPWNKFSDLVYQGVFNKFSDGNCYDYTKIPDSYKNPTPDIITNVFTLNPSLTRPVVKKEIGNPFAFKQPNELIERYVTKFMYDHSIDPKYIRQNTMFDIKQNGKGESPLKSVEKNINNLLAVYSARYNVYEKNMNAGILSYDPKSSNNMEEVVNPKTRDEIMKDLQERNGLTGARNFLGVSSIPLKFQKTIGTIAELQPFDETEADAVAIASIFGLDADLVPKRTPSKFANKIDGERKLWQTVIKSTAIERGVELSKAFYLPDNLVLYPNFSNVEILQEDKKTSFEADSILIDNLIKMQGAGQDVPNAFQKIKDKYESISL